MNGFDLNILKYLEGIRNEFFNILFKLITYIGEAPVVIGMFLIIYYVINKEYGKKIYFIYAGSITTSNLIKNFVQRPRPFALDFGVSCEYSDTATGYSFPSAHTQTVSTIWTSLSYARKKLWMTILSIVIILLVGFSRMYLGAHYPTDVIAGITFGVISAVIFSLLYEILKERKAFIFSIIFYSIFAIIFYIEGNELFADYFKTLGLFIGGFLGFIFEEKYVNFSTKCSLKIRLLRLLIGALGAGIIYFGLSKLFELFEINAYITILLDFIRYGILTFIVAGVMPLISKKILKE